MATLGFGTFFFDYDLDGWVDVLVTNGHIEESVTTVQPKVQFKQPPLLFRNTGKGRFEHASPTAGPDFAVPQAGRGAAYGDYDRDGDLDVLLVNNHPERPRPLGDRSQHGPDHLHQGSDDHPDDQMPKAPQHHQRQHQPPHQPEQGPP